MLHNSLAFGGGYMRKPQKKFRANSSGQLLIVAALAIAILISSTIIYVYELSKETNGTYDLPISIFVLSLKQATKNAVISSLANISNGDGKAIFSANLNELSKVFSSLNHFGVCNLAFTVLNNSDYDSGVRLSWNTSDRGVSSAYANFSLKAYGMATNVTLNYAVNITTAVTINGYYTKLVGSEKLVNLACNAYNEGEHALIKNMTLFYERLGSWIPVDSSNNPSITDYGNGTYHISFTAIIPSDNVQVSVHIHDLRDILVQANTTCSEI
jgi:hypothetical protein